MPVAYALTHDESGELQALYRNSLKSKATIERARTLIEATGAYEVVATRAADYEAKALSILESLNVPEARLRPLRTLADELAQRTY